MSSLEIEDEELTMRIFPMPLSGEKENGKNWTGGLHSLGKEGLKALLIDNFSRVPFSRGIRRENFVFANRTNQPT